MKVRTKFTIWISLTSMVVAVFFAAFVFLDFQEEAYDQVDIEVAEIAEAVATHYFSRPAGSEPKVCYPLKRYWLKVYGGDGKQLYATRLGQQVALSLPVNDKAYFVKENIGHENLWVATKEKDDLDELRSLTEKPVKLRARLFKFTEKGLTVAVHIAKPVPLLNADLVELLQELALGLIISVLLIFAVGYFVAGRLLQPLARINEQVREIREHSLDKRMKVGTSPDEVATLTTSLNNMFDRLEDSFQLQKEFVSNTAHELKSPLTVLMVSNEELLLGDLPANVRCSLQKEQQTLQRLNKLIRDLLSIARLEQQDSLTRQAVNLKEITAYVLLEYEDVIKAKSIIVTNSVSSVIAQLDREKFGRLLINLLDNAIKYNHAANGWISLSSSQKNNQIFLTISNSGPGIPPEDISEIFKQFYRVEKSRSQDHGGSGLGLTISKRIVELHGGEIDARSDGNETSIVVSLPDIQLP